MKKLHRRAFLKASAASLGAMALPTIVPATVLGANAPSNRIVMASIGTSGQGQGNMRNLLQQRDCHIVGVCDVDSNHRKTALNIVNKHYSNKDCAQYLDFRDVMARDDIDAVCISTPDHWHGLITLAAARAGKDIYCEKPLVNTIAEGKAVLKAVKRYGRVLQTGSHERSRGNARYACELVRNGRIGKLHTMIVNLPCTQSHHLTVINDRAEHPVMPVPPQLDYDRWLGPAPKAPYTLKRSHFSWRFIMDYGGGEMTDRGAHVIDIGQLGNHTDNTTPVEYQATGELPKSTLFNTYFNFEFECLYNNGVKMIGTSDEPRGIKFVGDEGWVFVHIHGGHLEASNPALLKETFGPNETHLGRTLNHHRNFLDCVKTREETMAPVHVGHHSAVICHLLNISMQLNGAKLKWDPKTETVLNNPTAQRMLRRSMRSPWQI